MERFPKNNEIFDGNEAKLSLEEVRKIGKKILAERGGEMREAVSPFSEAFTESDCRYVVGVFSKCGLVPAEDFLSRRLADILGLEAPQIVHVPKVKLNNNDGGISKDRKTIYVGNKNEGDDKYLFDINGDINNALREFKIISHEIWHSHQHDVVESNQPRAEIYKKEFQNYEPAYCNGEKNYKYAFQIVEVEAEMFAREIRSKIEDSFNETRKGK